MKKFLVAFLLIGLLVFSGIGYSADEVLFRSDTGNSKSIEITLDGTPGALSTVTLPSDAIGFKIWPRTNHVRFAINQALAAVATGTTTIAASDLAVGGIAKNDQWEVRLLPPAYKGTRILTLRSTTASVVVDLEVF
jgi:hypothetical protein